MSGPENAPLTPDCFLQIRPRGADSPIVPSFLSLDTDGRVLRLDSFSKVVAPGSRCGWLTGPIELITRVMNRSEASTVSTSACRADSRGCRRASRYPQSRRSSARGAGTRVSSSATSPTSPVRLTPLASPLTPGVYAERSLAMVTFFERHLPREACEWPQPNGGMFIWVRLRCETHPDVGVLEAEVIASQVFKAAIGELVLAAPSSFFKAPGGRQWTKEEDAGRIFFRVCYATPTMEQLEEGTRRLGRALRGSWRLPLDEASAR